MPTRRTFLETTGSVAALAILPDPSWFRPYRAVAPLKVGIVGVGRHGRAIITELQKIEGEEIAALCEIVSERLRVNVERIAGAASVVRAGLPWSLQPALPAGPHPLQD